MSSGGGNSVVDLEFDPAKTIEASRFIDSSHILTAATMRILIQHMNSKELNRYTKITADE